MADCDVCQAEEVAFIVGNAATGEQQFLGPACMGRLGLELAKAILPAEEIAAQLGPMFVEGAGPAEQNRPAATKRRKAKEPAPKPEPEAGPTPRQAETPPAAENG